MSASPGVHRGRPIRFLVALGLIWVGTRVAFVMLWPDPTAEPEMQAPQDRPIYSEHAETPAPDHPPVAPRDVDEPASLDEAAPAYVLDDPPPPHPEPLPAAAAHNSLWMSASSLEDAPGAVSPAGAQPAADKEEF